MLVVDAAQGIEAQTLANTYLALEHDLELLPVINKIDLPAADPERVRQEIEDIIGIDASEAYFKSLGMPVSIGALSCGVQDAAGVEDLAARVSYHGTRRVGTLVSLDHEALREIFEMANH